jgi:endonuclease III
MKKGKIKKVIEKLDEYFGKPYDYKSNQKPVLDVLIATKLSQNTTDKSAFIAFTNLKKKFKSWDKVQEAPISEIKNSIKNCGLSNTKAKNIKTMLQNMNMNYGKLDLNFMTKFDNEKIYEEFLQYDGIGVKTISCVLIFAFGREAFPVDTHVHRVLNRLGIVKTNSPVKTFENITAMIPKGKMFEFHSNLIKFGRNICRAKNPLCGICFLYNECEFKDKKFFRKKEIPVQIAGNNFIILEHI